MQIQGLGHVTVVEGLFAPSLPDEERILYRRDDYRTVLKYVNPRSGDRILDLGGGFGRIARVLARAGCEVTVVEQKRGLIQKGRYFFSNEPEYVQERVTWINGDITKPMTYLPMNWFCCALAWHYTINEILDDLLPVMENAHRCLERGGRLVLEVLPEGTYSRMREMEKLATHVDRQGRRWDIFTYVVPIDSHGRWHELIMVYECFRGERLEFRAMDSIRRRVWSAAEIEEAAHEAGFLLVEKSEDGKCFVFAKRV